VADLLSERDRDFAKLFKWAFAEYSSRLKEAPKPVSGLMLRILNGETAFFKIEKEVSAEQREVLTKFRRLRQDARLRKIDKLSKEWTPA